MHVLLQIISPVPEHISASGGASTAASIIGGTFVSTPASSKTLWLLSPHAASAKTNDTESRKQSLRNPMIRMLHGSFGKISGSDAQTVNVGVPRDQIRTAR